MVDRFVGCVRDRYKIKYANGITYMSDWIGGKVAMGTTQVSIIRPKMYTERAYLYSLKGKP